MCAGGERTPPCCSARAAPAWLLRALTGPECRGTGSAVTQRVLPHPLRPADARSVLVRVRAAVEGRLGSLIPVDGCCWRGFALGHTANPVALFELPPPQLPCPCIALRMPHLFYLQS
jgi:hypothetical protein